MALRDFSGWSINEIPSDHIQASEVKSVPCLLTRMLLVQTAFICAAELAHKTWLEFVLICIKASEVGKPWDLAECTTDLPTSNANIETCLKDAMMHSM